MMKRTLLLLVLGALGAVCAVAVTAMAASKGCVTVQGTTVCGPDIPDNPTVVCTGDACDSDANGDPVTPPDAGGNVTDDNNDPDAHSPLSPGGGSVGGGTNPGPPDTTGTTTTTEATATTESVAAPAPASDCDVSPSADIGVTAKVDTQQYTIGSMVQYSVDAFNDGSRGACPAPDATLTFQVPPQLELLSANGVSASNGSCAVTGGVGSQLATCSFGTLGPGQHVNVSVTARADTVGSATATAGVSTTVPDPNVGGNQRSSVTVTVTAPSSNTSTEHPPASATQPAPSGQTTTMPSHLRLPDTPPEKALPRTLLLPN